MTNTTIHYLAIACTCLLLAACGEDGETTESTANAGGNGGGVEAGNHGRVQFSAPTFEAGEGTGSATVTIIRTDGSDGAVSVRVTSRDGTATAADYTAVAATVSFGAGDSAAKTVTVPIANDAVDEPDETLDLTLSATAGGVSLGSASETLLTILDDDITAPTAPKAVLSAAYKQLHIDWTSVSGATSYRLLKDPTGNAGFTQIGADLPATAKSVDFDVVVHKEDWLNARYVIAACNAAGCTQSSAISADGNSVPLIGYLKASTTSESDNFGSAVALSADGNTLAVGAADAGDAPALFTGAVYVYTRSGSDWSAPAYLKASNAENFDRFGSALALSDDGNTLIVGAPGEDSADSDPNNNTAFDAGAAYVFTRTGNTWSQVAYLKSSEAAGGDNFGRSLAISPDGTVLAVGSPSKDTIVPLPGTSLVDRGAAYVFTGSGSTWTQSPPLTAPVPASSASFGISLALSNEGAALAIGASGEAVNTANGAGAVHFYTRSGPNWSYGTRITASTAQGSASFGYSIALSTDGATLAAGARFEDSASADPLDPVISSTGAAYVYDISGSTATETAHLKASNAGEFDNFGSSIDLSGDGNTLAVTALGESGGSAGVSGPTDDTLSSSGAAYVFTRAAAAWSERSYVKSSNPETDDQFGFSVALNADGSTLVVGATDEDSAATGLNGNQLDDCAAVTETNCANNSGAAYIY